MNFFIWRKNVSYLIYLIFFVFVKLQFSKSVTSLQSLLHNGSYVLACFFSNPKYYQNKICSNTSVLITNISNMFLDQCWRLETSSRAFHDFSYMTIHQDLSTLSIWYLPFLILPYSPFQKHETLETWHNWLLSNWSRLLNWKKPGT